MIQAVPDDWRVKATDQQSEFSRIIREHVAKTVVGQQDVVERVMIALLTGGHLLLEGVPGIAKTLLVQTVSKAIDLQFKRVQFTTESSLAGWPSSLRRASKPSPLPTYQSLGKLASPKLRLVLSSSCACVDRENTLLRRISEIARAANFTNRPDASFIGLSTISYYSSLEFGHCFKCNPPVHPDKIVV